MNELGASVIPEINLFHIKFHIKLVSAELFIMFTPQVPMTAGARPKAGDWVVGPRAWWDHTPQGNVFHKFIHDSTVRCFCGVQHQNFRPHEFLCNGQSFIIIIFLMKPSHSHIVWWHPLCPHLYKSASLAVRHQVTFMGWVVCGRWESWSLSSTNCSANSKNPFPYVTIF